MAGNRINQALENIANGEPFDNPRTDDEVMLSKIAAGEEVTENARNRFQYWLKQIDVGGSFVTVEPLTVTANGTTIAPSGTAYSPVTVNVQPVLQTKSVTINDNGTLVIVPDSGYDGLAGVNVTTNVPTGGSNVTLIAPEVVSATQVSISPYSALSSVFCCMNPDFGVTKDTSHGNLSIYYTEPSNITAEFDIQADTLTLSSGNMSFLSNAMLRIVIVNT